MNSKALNEQIAEQLFTCSRLLKDEMSFTSDAAQLTILQLHALIFIDRNEAVTMTEVSNHFHISLPTATSLSNKLVTAKLIRRETNKEDRRLVKLVLTAKGKELLTEAMKQRSEKLRNFLSYLSDTQKEQLLHIMQSLVAQIEKQ